MAQAFIPQQDPYSIPSGFTQTQTSGGGTGYITSSGDFYIRTNGGFQLRNDLKPSGAPPPPPRNDALAPTYGSPQATYSAPTGTTPAPSSSSSEVQKYVTALQKSYLPGRNPGESTEDWARRIAVDPNTLALADQQVNGGAQSSSGTSGQGVNLPPEYQALYDSLKTYLDKLQASGQRINPNIQITPEKVAEFMTQAQNEIQPFYATQLKLAKDQFLQTLGFTTEQIVSQEKQLESQYGRKVRDIASSSAERGFAQSGIRQREEGELASDTQSQIDENRRRLGFSFGEQAGKVAQQFGGAAIPTSSSLSAAPRVLAGVGGFDRPGGTSPFYQLSPDVYSGLVGEQQFAERGAIQNRASQLEEAFRLKESINQTRQLNL